MPKFYKVLLLQDAWINHEALISSAEHGVASAQEAADAAVDQWKGRRDDITLTEAGEAGFDHVEAHADDVEEISAEEYAAAVEERDHPTAGPTWEPDALIAAAREFVAKVDRGEARSKRSYDAFKAALQGAPE